MAMLLYRRVISCGKYMYIDNSWMVHGWMKTKLTLTTTCRIRKVHKCPSSGSMVKYRISQTPSPKTKNSVLRKKKQRMYWTCSIKIQNPRHFNPFPPVNTYAKCMVSKRQYRVTRASRRTRVNSLGLPQLSGSGGCSDSPGTAHTCKHVYIMFTYVICMCVYIIKNMYMYMIDYDCIYICTWLFMIICIYIYMYV